MSSFAHLHVHTEYSLLDGACIIKRLVSRVKELGQTACAITDHGCMYGVIDFYKECKKQGIRPVIGCEVYVAPRTRFDKVHKLDTSPYHLVLLCKNNTGYQNLIKLVSMGYIDGFYNKPRVDHDILKEHSEGLICLSACLAGELPRYLLAGDYEKAKETALWYRDVFGEGNYYIEIQDHGIKEQQTVLPELVRLAQETGIGLVATNDAHYILKEDSKMQSVLTAIQTNTTVGEGSLEFATDEFYIKSREEMESLFSAWPEALDNTQKIADQCDVEFEFGVTKLPYFSAPDGRDNDEYFVSLCNEGLKKRYGDKLTQEMIDRLQYEIDIISRMGYVNYYLIVHDFIKYAKDNGIPVGPGRGSGAASIAAYAIGITDIDPIKYQLIFERFLNPERITMPDFDVDFCNERRQEVIDYVVRKYGSDHVAQIITFGTMAARGAIRDVGRALGMPYQQVDSIAKLVPMTLHITIEQALKDSQELRTAYEGDPKVKELIDTAQKLEGMPRHASTHAAGVVITREAASEYVPLQKNEDAIVTQFPMTTIEELGLLKMDFLGLRNLTVIHDCEEMIRAHTPDFRVADIDTEDQKVFKMLSAGDSQAVFQLESPGMRRLIMQIHPTSIEDLIAVISLYRPGPMESIPLYVRNNQHPELITYKHPMLKPILDVTYGCIVYQEQVMQICREMAGYSYGRADLIRRAMSKKKHDVMEQERQNFIHGKVNEDGSIECVGAVKNGVSEQIANEIFDEMTSFASYAFNKAHAACYAIVAYQTAYLKCHYTQEYMCAWLTSIMENTDKLIENIEECGDLGIKVLPPDVNESGLGFTVSGADIRFGLLAVKNIGRGFIQNVLSERDKGGRYQSLPDFCSRMRGRELNKRTLESLIKCGAMDGLGHTRRQMLLSYEQILDNLDSAARSNVEGQINLFSGSDAAPTEFVMPQVEDFSLKERLAMEKETTGLYLSGHPLGQYNDLIKRYNLATVAKIMEGGETQDARYGDNANISILAVIQAKKLINTRSKQTMAFITLEDMTGTIELVVFPNTYADHTIDLTEGAIFVVQAHISIKENESPKLICDQLLTPEEYSPDKVQQRQPRKSGTSRQRPPLMPKSRLIPESDVAQPEREKASRRLCIKINNREDKRLEQVMSMLSRHVGRDEVLLYFADEKRRAVPKNLGIEISDSLIEQLRSILSENDVVVQNR